MVGVIVLVAVGVPVKALVTDGVIGVCGDAITGVARTSAVGELSGVSTACTVNAAAVIISD